MPFKNVDFSEDALSFAQANGFVSLEVEEDIPLERVQFPGDQPKREKKKDKRKKDSGESVHDDARQADVNKDAKAGKQRKKPKHSEAVGADDDDAPHGSSSSAPLLPDSGDLFASLVAEMKQGPRKSPVAPSEPRDAAAPSQSKKAKTKATLPKAVQDIDSDDDDDEDDDDDDDDDDEGVMEDEDDEDDGEDMEEEEEEEGESMQEEEEEEEEEEEAEGEEEEGEEAMEDEATAGNGEDDDIAAPVELSPVWRTFGLHDDLLAKIAANGFVKPTPIQQACLPAALHGRRDVVGAAETGSGKTLAFGLPILQSLLAEPSPRAKPERLYALIVAPTRELANQVASHLRAVAPEGVDVVSLVGGMSIDKQRRLLARKPEIAVGTPGRLWELASDGGMTPHLGRLSELRFFVLDEVDKMVEAGHFRELRNILGQVERKVTNDDGAEGFAEEEDTAAATAAAGAPSAAAKRQTFLFSATLMLPPNAKEANAKALAKAKPTKKDSTMDTVLRMLVFRNSLKVIDLSRPELVAAGLTQAQLSCTHEEKDVFLFLLLRTRLASGRTIVFTNAVTALVRLRSLLSLLELPMPLIALQGGMQQRARLKALDRFRSLPSGVLLATDVAARGLDISGVDSVVHYQLPRSAEVYVHRSGRTARAASCGLSVALVEPADIKSHRRLCADLAMPDGLEELAVDAQMLPRVREVVAIARRLDIAAHAKSKKRRASSQRKKLAREMDLGTDSDDDSDDERRFESETERRQAAREKQQNEQLRANLKRLLGRIERPTGKAVHLVAKGGAKWQ